ncbi:MAG: Flp pilus assembly protein CpaB [Elusimicrobia bacterium RIFCSPLOWO2_12_FULL_59_9]|nr:MAG: Flp pilus assembly protein CpaB [Elusimicrobia bacterium RIFCSPLOWO2_12_FULL_59_9]
MEKKGAFIPLALAIVAALVYVMVLSNREKALSKAYETTQVLVAKVDIPPRTVLRPALVEVMSIPRKFMAQDAFEYKSPTDIQEIKNQVTRVRVPKGNQLIKSTLMGLSAEAGLSVKIPPGYRGAALEVDTNLLQLIKPGDRVDVLVTFDAVMSDRHKEKVTATILQNILVLGVGRNLGQGLTAQQDAALKKQSEKEMDFEAKGALTVALNPNEAQYLSLALKQGDVFVVVRWIGDLEMHPIEMASFRKLFTS